MATRCAELVLEARAPDEPGAAESDEPSSPEWLEALWLEALWLAANPSVTALAFALASLTQSLQLLMVFAHVRGLSRVYSPNVLTLIVIVIHCPPMVRPPTW
jgi:hypothetical protein